MKKFLSVILTLVMALSVMPCFASTVFAADDAKDGFTLKAKVKGYDTIYGNGDTIKIPQGKSLISFDITDGNGVSYIAGWYSFEMTYSTDLTKSGFIMYPDPEYGNTQEDCYAAVANNTSAGETVTLNINGFSFEKYSRSDFDWITTEPDVSFTLKLQALSKKAAGAGIAKVKGDSTEYKNGSTITVAAGESIEVGHSVPDYQGFAIRGCNPTYLEKAGFTFDYETKFDEDENPSWVISTKGLKEGTSAKLIFGMNDLDDMVYNNWDFSKTKPFYSFYVNVKVVNKCDKYGTEHKYVKTVKKATTTANGKTEVKCSNCGAVSSSKIFYKASDISLSTTKYTYDGNVKKPTVSVKTSAGTKLSTASYDVSYASGRKYVGKYKVVVKLKGNYEGSVTKYFTINPKGTTISSLTPVSKGFKASWKKQSVQTSGYQIQYSTSSKFTDPKTVTVSGTTSVSKTISKLTAKKK